MVTVSLVLAALVAGIDAVRMTPNSSFNLNENDDRVLGEATKSESSVQSEAQDQAPTDDLGAGGAGVLLEAEMVKHSGGDTANQTAGGIWDDIKGLFDGGGGDANKGMGDTQKSFARTSTASSPPGSIARRMSNNFNAKDSAEIGRETFKTMKEAVWDDVTSHKVEICFLTFSKDKIDFASHKCMLGVSCDSCKHFKIELRAGIDLCKGAKFTVKSEFTLRSPVHTGVLEIGEIFDKVVQDMGDVARTFNVRANILLEMVMETIAENTGAESYPRRGIKFAFELRHDVAVGAGVGAEAQLGYDLCNRENPWHCFGMDAGGGIGLKAEGKLFVCFNPKEKAIKIEIGVGNYAGELKLTFISGTDKPLIPTASTVAAHVNTQLCMSTPQWRSRNQKDDDGPCHQKSSGGCNGDCYWQEPHNRRKGCFATKGWKDKHSGQGDGWCAAAGREEDCVRHLHCVWSFEPCESENCKDLQRIKRDLSRVMNQDACMAKPKWKSQHQSTGDGHCEGRSRGRCGGYCYWTKRAYRSWACWATKEWKDRNPGKKDGLCALVSRSNCNRYDHCAYSTNPCTQYGTCNEWNGGMMADVIQR